MKYLIQKNAFLPVIFLCIILKLNGQVKDIESNVYKTVIIGKQDWMAENLNVAYFKNGEPIPEAKTDMEWQKAGEAGKPAWCYYMNDKENGKTYGKLYNWYAVSDPRGLAPDGWRIPTDEDFIALETFLGGGQKAGIKMKSTSGWKENGNGTNESGFNGLAGGCRNDDGEFFHLGFYGYWWSATEFLTYFSWGHMLNYYTGIEYKMGVLYEKVEGLSVRCIRDNS